MAKVEMRRSGAQAADDLVRLVAEKKWSEVVRAAEILSALSRRAELPLGMWRADRLTGILLGAEAAAAPDAPDSDWHCPSPGRAHRPAHMNPLSPPHRSSLRRSPAHLEASCLDLLAAWLQQLTGYMRKNRGALLTAELEELVARARALALSVARREAPLLTGRPPPAPPA
ncbi:hypothetical protein T484DRAFT_1917310, partial [Baffinella frigidus]